MPTINRFEASNLLPLHLAGSTDGDEDHYPTLARHLGGLPEIPESLSDRPAALAVYRRTLTLVRATFAAVETDPAAEVPEPPAELLAARAALQVETEAIERADGDLGDLGWLLASLREILARTSAPTAEPTAAPTAAPASLSPEADARAEALAAVFTAASRLPGPELARLASALESGARLDVTGPDAVSVFALAWPATSDGCVDGVGASPELARARAVRVNAPIDAAELTAIDAAAVVRVECPRAALPWLIRRLSGLAAGPDLGELLAEVSAGAEVAGA